MNAVLTLNHLYVQSAPPRLAVPLLVSVVWSAMALPSIFLVKTTRTGTGRMINSFVVANGFHVVNSHSGYMLACHSSPTRRILKIDYRALLRSVHAGTGAIIGSATFSTGVAYTLSVIAVFLAWRSIENWEGKKRGSKGLPVLEVLGERWRYTAIIVFVLYISRIAMQKSQWVQWRIIRSIMI